MDETIDVSFECVRAIIQALRSEGFSTGDIIREYGGGFFSNAGTPVCDSLNAQFGKRLKRNMKAFVIKDVVANAPLKDDRGQQTSVSIWTRVA